MSEHRIDVTINGAPVSAVVEARRTLGDFLRLDVGQTGLHLGCEHGACGACTIILDGDAVRSCLMLAVQANGASVTTIEGLAAADGALHPVQQAMQDEYGLQCGFCTPGLVMTLAALSSRQPPASAEDMLAALSGHLCRCTGYQGILRATRRVAAEAKMRAPA
jgi:carbon-monoxide dehydrogenase small subunit